MSHYNPKPTFETIKEFQIKHYAERLIIEEDKGNEKAAAFLNKDLINFLKK